MDQRRQFSLDVQRSHAVSTQRGHVGLFVLSALSLDKGVYHIDLNMNCPAKKCYQMCWNKHIQSVNLFSKSHNAPVPCPSMHHTKWCIVGYLSIVFWNLWDGCLVEISWMQHELWNIKLSVTIHTFTCQQHCNGTHLTRCSQGIYVVTKWYLFIKKITVAHQVKEQIHSPIMLIMIFHQLDITLEFSA